jgi:hypothetical protein
VHVRVGKQDCTLRGRWRWADDDLLVSDVAGMLGGDAVTGRVEVRPRRALGVVVGLRHITLELAAPGRRLVADADVGVPPYLLGVGVPGRVIEADEQVDVELFVDPAQMLGLGLELAVAPPRRN